MIVTLDGPAGSGKSTLAGMLAAELGIAYLDTGAMYRAAALHLNGLDPDSKAFADWLNAMRFSLHKRDSGYVLALNGRDLGDEIRTQQAGALASQIAANPLVRKKMQAKQREIACQVSIVVEGRDMGTIVFPQAEHKFFLEADPEVRARRRYLELQAKGVNTSESEILRDILERDKQDSQRELDPLRAAEDAIFIDTSKAGPEELTAKLAALVREPGLSHLDAAGNVHMVDVGAKTASYRVAKAKSGIQMNEATMRLLTRDALPKGNVLATVKIAGILAAKKTSDLIPLCHPLALTYVNLEFHIDQAGNRVEIEAEVRTDGKTGVEMEAIIAAQIAAATIYDMAKAVQKDMVIEETRLTYKCGGKSGEFSNP